VFTQAMTDFFGAASAAGASAVPATPASYWHETDFAGDAIYVCNAFQSGHQKLVTSENLGTT
jgi:hypothetical protein